MENYIVSARKYRPSTFEMVVGQDTITSTLKNAIKNDKLAQAFLFCGPRGVGKTTCARILAKTINCQNLKDNCQPCDACPSCVSFNELTSFNIHELDAASNNSVDDIRALVDQVRIPPQVGKYKVYIIDEVHMLSSAAFNAFLKTLEEPPSFAKFILATTEKHKILPTILSRCQIFDFKRITVEGMASYLAYVAESEKISADTDALHTIAQKADGAMRDALSIFDQLAISTNNRITFQSVIDNLNILDYEYYFKMTEIILESRYFDALNLIDTILENGFDGQIFLEGFASHLRNLLVCKNTSTLNLLEASENIKNKYAQLAKQCDDDFIIRNLDIVNRFDFEYKSSNHKRLHLELAFIKMCSLNEGPAENAQTSYPLNKKKTEPVEKKAEDKKETSYTYTDKPDFTEKNEIKKAVLSAGKIISITEDKEKTHTIAEEKKIDYGNEAITSESLEKAWDEMASQYEKQASFYRALKSRNPEIDETGNIYFLFDNKIQYSEFKTKKPEILHKLRVALKNGNVDIDGGVSEMTEDNTQPFTSEEKYRKMLEKNPDLKKFKDSLDLEIE